MATSISTSFVGIGALDFVSKALLEATSLKNGHLTVIPNVKYSYKLQIADLSTIIQADGCDFNALGTISLSERVLTPAKLKVNFKDCKTVLESHWQSEKMRAGAMNSSYTTEFSSWLDGYMAAKVATGIELSIWQGNTGGTSSIYVSNPFLTANDGLVVKMLADATVIDVAKTTITSSNVLAEIEKVFAAIPDTIFDSPELKIFVPRSVLRAYQTAIPTTYAANGNFDITGAQPTYYKGIPLVAVGLADNNMIAAKTSNLFFGTDLEGDFMERTVLDFSTTDLSDNIGYKMRFSMDVNHGIGAEVVLYS